MTEDAARGEATHLMIRIALAGVAVGVAIAVGYEVWHHDCRLTSISAYWYTDARTIFAGGLMIIGIALIAYSGGTWTENLLLNLAGILAPIVAIAPTGLGRTEDEACLGTPLPAYDQSATDNGLFVYFVLIAAGAVLTWLLSRNARPGGLSGPRLVAQRTGQALSLAAPGALWVWWQLDGAFPQHAHFPSAAVMFVFLALVAGARTERGSRLTRRWDVYRDDSVAPEALNEDRSPVYAKAYGVLYGIVCFGMLGTLLAAGVNLLLGDGGYAYGVIVAEFVLLGLFLLFWVAQTIQMQKPRA